MQLCKQTTKNPKIESTIKGWELMAAALATFPPSKLLKTFLQDYIQKTAAPADKTTSVDARIQKMAAFCLGQFDKILGMGQRKQVPSKAELEALKLLQPVPIRVSLLNGESKVVGEEGGNGKWETETDGKWGRILAGTGLNDRTHVCGQATVGREKKRRERRGEVNPSLCPLSTIYVSQTLLF